MFRLRNNGNGYIRWRCITCEREWKHKSGRQKKRILVEEAGGLCMDCGKSYPDYTMHFDHLDPAEKSFGIGTKLTYNIDILRLEAAKCELVCANCHAERTAVRAGYSWLGA